MKNNFFTAFLIISMLIIVFCMFFLNDIVIHIRLLELQAFLQKTNRENTNYDFLGILSQYKLYKDWYNNNIDENQLASQEIKISYLISNIDKNKSLSLTKYKLLSKPVIFALNKIRYLTGLEPIENLLSNNLDDFLILAYYYERNKKFFDAINTYDKILGSKKVIVNEDKKPVIILHQGFCHSITGDFNKAKEKYLYIIDNYKEKEISVIAAILLRYLEGFESEIIKVKSSNEDSVTKSEKLIKLIAYTEALEILNSIKKTENKDEDEKIKFYQARCYEELGNNEESIKKYQEIIIKDHKSKYSKNANKRILIMASNDENGDDLKELAEKNNELIVDDEFRNLLDFSKKINFKEYESDKIAKELGKDSYTEKEKNITDTDQNETKEQSDNEIQNFIAESNKTMENKIEQEKSIEMKDKIQNQQKKKKPEQKKTIEYTKKTEEKIIKIKEPYTKYYKDEKERIYKAEKYDGNDKLLSSIIYEYDENGTPIAVKLYDSQGNQIK